GHVALLDADLVYGLEGPGRLCQAPKNRKLEDRFTGCAANAPFVEGSKATSREVVTIFHGPVVVRRRGALATSAIISGAVSWRANVRALPAPAPRGTTRLRGTVSLGRPLRGDTSDARDGFRPECVEAGGSPDESFRFVAPAFGSYAFSLESAFDG